MFIRFRSSLIPLCASVAFFLWQTAGAGAAPILSETSEPPSASINLSAEGTLDWAHWGLNSGKNVTHKSATGDGGGPAVGLISESNILPVLVATTANGPETFSWTGGRTTASASTTNVTLFDNIGNGSGIRISVPAASDLRTLNLYVGLFNESGNLAASMVDSANVTLGTLTDTSFSSPSGSATRRFSLDFAADLSDALAQTLVVTWTGAQNFGGGDLWIGGATLTPEPAGMAIILSGLALLARRRAR
jgi:hypothetical protein